MKTHTIKLYEYDELSPEAKKKALELHAYAHEDPFMQSHMINLLTEKLDEHGIKYGYPATDPDVRYSLSDSQGDGFMFTGEFQWKQYTVYIKHDGNPHYYHSRTANIEIQETDNLGFHVDDDHADVRAFGALYETLCKEMEQLGYDHIEYQTSEEYFIGECEANGYTFEADGTMRNV